MSAASTNTPAVSVIVPVRNEAGNIAPLVAEIAAALAGRRFEVIYVNDGSTDGTEAELKRLAALHLWLRQIRHAHSCGQSAALRTGMTAARAPIVVTLDGDGQNDPAFLPKLIEALEHGAPKTGLIAGQRICRKATGFKQFQSRVAKAERDGRRMVLCEPQTYMNLSGEAVGALVSFFQLPLKQLIVTVDDADLPLGEIRLRPSGSSGGHHGLESIEAHLGTREYARLRIGIGRKDATRQIAGHVLGRLNAAELAVLEKVLARAANQVECWLAHGLAKAMSQFNGVVEDSTNEGKK